MKRQIICLLIVLLLPACGTESYTPYSGFCKQVVSEDDPYVYVIMEDESLWAWGDMGLMNLGFLPSEYEEYEVTEPMLVNTDILDVSAYSGATVFVRRDHSLWAVGLLNMNPGSDARQVNRITVHPVKLMENVRSGLVANGCIFAVTMDNVLYGRGSGQYGVLGLGDEEDRYDFEMIMEDVEAVYTGSYYSTYIVQTDGTLWGCGMNMFHQMPGLSEQTDFRTTPVKIAEGVEKVYQSSFGCYLLKQDGTLWTWGENDTPGLANETREMRLLMEEVKDIGRFGLYLGVLMEDGSLFSLKSDYVEDQILTSDLDHIANNVTSFTKSSYGNFYTTEDGKLYGVDGQVDAETNTLFLLKNVPLDIEQPVVLFQPEESDEDAP